MSVRLHKRLLMQVGSFVPHGGGKPKPEWREIGIQLKHTIGENEFCSLRLQVDILNPQLFTLARGVATKGTSFFDVTLVDPTRKTQEHSELTEIDLGDGVPLEIVGPIETLLRRAMASAATCGCGKSDCQRCKSVAEISAVLKPLDDWRGGGKQEGAEASK